MVNMTDIENKILAPIDGVGSDIHYLQEEIPAEEKIRQAQLYRRMHYPPIQDYLDGVVKGDQNQIDAYIAACLAVKARFPKPQ